MRIHVLEVLLLSLSLGTLACSSEEQPTRSIEELLAEDDRLAVALADCPEGRLFDGDTTRMTAVLVNKLRFGQLDPLRQARRELAEIGQPAIEELTRLFDSCYSDRWLAGVLINIVDVCALMDGPYGVDLIRRALEHPQETVRLACLDGLKKWGDASDYDDVELWLGLSTSSTARGDFGRALQALDPERFEKDLLLWIDEERNQDIFEFVLQPVMKTESREFARELFDRVLKMRETEYPFVQAVGVKFGLSGASEGLRASLGSESPTIRLLAARACGIVGLGEEVEPLFRSDPRPDIRLAALQALLESDDERIEGWIELGLADVDHDVRAGALVALCERGNERAIAEALALLEGRVGDRELAMRALRSSWDAAPQAIAPAFESLKRQFESHDSASGVEQISYLQAMGQVPGRRSAEYLWKLALQTNTPIRGLHPRRWCVIQIINAGPEAYRFLRERLAVSTDPFEQIDLLYGIWQDRSDESRTAMLTLLERADVRPEVRLYAADRCAYIGPAHQMAPTLKRTYLAATLPLMRKGLQCLLWRWYGNASS